MSVHLGTLYHWSPKRNRRSILRDGLQIMREMVDMPEYALPRVCLGTTPSTAWGLVPDCDAKREVAWDLWQVSVQDGDEISIQGAFCPYVREVRVHHGLPADRVWWVGERHYGPHITIDDE